jgi:predicted ABC-type transport system involved in lysophospholipase L1 biosynthesis ATPase subunit
MSAGLHIESLKSPLAGPFDLDVACGEAVVVSGPSGAGKSLFLRMIADLDPNTGEVTLGGRSRADMPAPAWRRLCPYVGAEPGWWAPTIASHFATEHLDPARDLARRLGLSDALFEAAPGRLSTGERQRLALIRALVLASPALLADEPTGNLDPATTAEAEAILRERLAAGLVLILVSHDPAQGERLNARALRMVAGHLEVAR